MHDMKLLFPLGKIRFGIDEASFVIIRANTESVPTEFWWQLQGFSMNRDAACITHKVNTYPPSFCMHGKVMSYLQRPFEDSDMNVFACVSVSKTFGRTSQMRRIWFEIPLVVCTWPKYSVSLGNTRNRRWCVNFYFMRIKVSGTVAQSVKDWPTRITVMGQVNESWLNCLLFVLQVTCTQKRIVRFNLGSRAMYYSSLSAEKKDVRHCKWKHIFISIIVLHRNTVSSIDSAKQMKLIIERLVKKQKASYGRFDCNSSHWPQSDTDTRAHTLYTDPSHRIMSSTIKEVRRGVSSPLLSRQHHTVSVKTMSLLVSRWMLC